MSLDVLEQHGHDGLVVAAHIDRQSNVSNHRPSSNDHHNHPGVPPPRKVVLRTHYVMLIVRFLLVNGTYEGLLRIS